MQTNGKTECLYVWQCFNDYFTVNHSRLLSLWRTAVTFRRQFAELKETTDRELATLRAEFGRLSRGMNSACLSLSSQLRSNDLRHQVSVSHLLLYVAGPRNQSVCVFLLCFYCRCSLSVDCLSLFSVVNVWNIEHLILSQFQRLIISVW